MNRVLVFIVLAFVLAGCSVISANLFGGLQEPEASIICPTCLPTQECPTYPTATQPGNTSTPVASATPVPSSTPLPSATLAPSATPVTVVPSATPVVFPFELQPGSPAYTQNFARPNDACNWSGIAGQVLDKNGQPLKNMVVVVTGKYDNKNIDLVSLTGIATSYGPGGYEITLGAKPLAGDQVYIALFDLAGAAQSPKFQLATQADCKKNLIVINFIKK